MAKGSHSLLSQVLRSRDNPSATALLDPVNDQAHTLSDGSTIYDSTIAAIDRILSLNPHLHKRPTGVSSSPYQLYNSHAPVDLTNRRTFLSLVKADWVPRTPFQVILVERFVIKYAPVFSRDCVVVSEGLLWDRCAGKLRSFTDKEPICAVS